MINMNRKMCYSRIVCAHSLVINHPRGARDAASFSRRDLSITASNKAIIPGSWDPEVWVTVTPIGRIEKIET